MRILKSGIKVGEDNQASAKRSKAGNEYDETD
jgi:hypothetical protein